MLFDRAEVGCDRSRAAPGSVSNSADCVPPPTTDGAGRGVPSAAVSVFVWPGILARAGLGLDEGAVGVKALPPGPPGDSGAADTAVLGLGASTTPSTRDVCAGDSPGTVLERLAAEAVRETLGEALSVWRSGAGACSVWREGAGAAGVLGVIGGCEEEGCGAAAGSAAAGAALGVAGFEGKGWGLFERAAPGVAAEASAVGVGRTGASGAAPAAANNLVDAGGAASFPPIALGESSESIGATALGAVLSPSSSSNPILFSGAAGRV